jgi:hypothetical protein
MSDWVKLLIAFALGVFASTAVKGVVGGAKSKVAGG